MWYNFYNCNCLSTIINAFKAIIEVNRSLVCDFKNMGNFMVQKGF